MNKSKCWYLFQLNYNHPTKKNHWVTCFRRRTKNGDAAKRFMRMCPYGRVKRVADNV
jgi:hypothetical protein